MKITKSKYSGVFWSSRKKWPATENLTPGKKVYDEVLVEKNSKEYREWNPYKSKLAAALKNNLRKLPIEKGDKVLYLGAASGTTASHVSDIVGEEGKVFCVEISRRVMRDLIFLTEERSNMIPLLEDANKPESYENVVEECDVVYEDVAQPNQDEILIKNSEKFLKEGGYAMIAVKARCIDVSKEPREIFKNLKVLFKEEFEIVDSRRIEPFEKDHKMFLLKK